MLPWEPDCPPDRIKMDRRTGFCEPSLGLEGTCPTLGARLSTLIVKMDRRTGFCEPSLGLEETCATLGARLSTLIV